jgi:hypothetical protein
MDNEADDRTKDVFFFLFFVVCSNKKLLDMMTYFEQIMFLYDSLKQDFLL